MTSKENLDTSINDQDPMALLLDQEVKDVQQESVKIIGKKEPKQELNFVQQSTSTIRTASLKKVVSFG